MGTFFIFVTFCHTCITVVSMEVEPKLEMYRHRSTVPVEAPAYFGTLPSQPMPEASQSEKDCYRFDQKHQRWTVEHRPRIPWQKKNQSRVTFETPRHFSGAARPVNTSVVVPELFEKTNPNLACLEKRNGLQIAASAHVGGCTSNERPELSMKRSSTKHTLTLKTIQKTKLPCMGHLGTSLNYFPNPVLLPVTAILCNTYILGRNMSKLSPKRIQLDYSFSLSLSKFWGLGCAWAQYLIAGSAGDSTSR